MTWQNSRDFFSAINWDLRDSTIASLIGTSPSRVAYWRSKLNAGASPHKFKHARKRPHGNLRLSGVKEAARVLGCSYFNLRKVLIGERRSERLLQRYQELVRANPNKRFFVPIIQEAA